MQNELPQWVSAAIRMPIAFAQVREDPIIDLWAIDQFSGAVRVMMIASGGCTAAALVGSPNVESIHVVDPNPAQLTLARLKLRLLQTASLAERLAILGHTSLEPEVRAGRLKDELQAMGLPETALGPPDVVSTIGPDYAGRYEFVFAELQQLLQHRKQELEVLLSLADPAEQQRLIGPQSALGKDLDAALQTAMTMENLVALFGEEATRNPVAPFATHFAERIRHVLATQPASANTYLWQMLVGRFPPGVVSPWFLTRPPTRLPNFTWANMLMDKALSSSQSDFHFIHLSNILDWLTEQRAQTTLKLAWDALRPGGLVVVRQLNSTLDIEALAPKFRWLKEPAQKLHARDRSFFYRALHIGQKT